MDASEILTDLAAESAVVDRWVADLPPSGWQLPTPAPGWTVGHQIAHLAWTDDAARLAITDPDAFGRHLATAAHAPESFVDDAAAHLLATADDLLGYWRAGRDSLADAIAAVAPGAKIPWYGTAMSAASLATARLMETWAHGLDIADALGVTPVPTARLRHIAYLGHRTLGFAFLAHDRPVPTQPVRVVLDAPDGTQWTLGPADTDQLVTGPALDFCRLVTQRAHRDDLALVATGAVATEWLDVAQAFAGPPGKGRSPRSGLTTDPATSPATASDASPASGSDTNSANGSGSGTPGTTA